MPIYELYCRPCHTVFSFFSARVNTTASPPCPRCARPGLERKPSTFATLKRRAESTESGEEGLGLEGMDENRLMGAMESLLGEAEGLENEEDPRAMARLMRRFGDLTGLEMGEKMEDYVARLEAGEDPESLEREMELEGEGSEEELEDFFKLKKAAQARRGRPRVDETLYFL
jgi:hypothetical protein